MAFKMKGFPLIGDVANDQLKSQVGDGTNNSVPMLETEKQLQAYNEHMSQMPKFEKGAGIGSHFNTFVNPLNILGVLYHVLYLLFLVLLFS